MKWFYLKIPKPKITKPKIPKYIKNFWPKFQLLSFCKRPILKTAMNNKLMIPKSAKKLKLLSPNAIPMEWYFFPIFSWYALARTENIQRPFPKILVMAFLFFHEKFYLFRDGRHTKDRGGYYKFRGMEKKASRKNWVLAFSKIYLPKFR